MSSEYDSTEFVDDDFQGRHKAAAPAPAPVNRAPTREEVDVKVGETQSKLAELKRAQEELERERANLEETRRRQIEFQTGRQEVLQQLARAVSLIEEAEFAARRDTEQMAKALAEMRDAFAKVEAAREESWSGENFPVELSRGLALIENARMELNTARLKFPVLSPAAQNPGPGPEAPKSPPDLFAGRSFAELCKLGLALTAGPVAVLAVLALCILLAVLSRK